jgi:hypothetical protein
MAKNEKPKQNQGITIFVAGNFSLIVSHESHVGILTIPEKVLLDQGSS